MIAICIGVLHAHDRLRRLRHVLWRVYGSRRRLKMVMRRVHRVHLVLLLALMHHVAALLQLMQAFAQLELGIRVYVLLLLGRRRASILAHEQAGGVERRVGIAIGAGGGHDESWVPVDTGLDHGARRREQREQGGSGRAQWVWWCCK